MFNLIFQERAMKATYTSVFDDSIHYASSCDYDPKTKVVSNIEPCDDSGVKTNCLTDEYVVLQDGTILRENDGVVFDY